MTYRKVMNRVLWAVAALILGGSLMSCQKSEKLSTAGGGSSTQSVLSVKGAAR